MPLPLSTIAIEEKNKLATDSVFLVCLEITIPGVGTPIYIVNNNEDITWKGVTWVAVPFSISELSDQSASEVPSVTIQVNNVSRVMDQYLQQYDAYVKLYGYSPLTVNIYVINTKAIAVKSVTSIDRENNVVGVVCVDHQFSIGQDVYISGADQTEYNGVHNVTSASVNEVTFVITTTPTTPATGAITAQLATPEVSHIFELKNPSADDQYATFVLGASNPYNRRFPQNRILANSCRFRFKDVRCKYVGVETVCDHSLSRCRVLSNVAHYGGFPGVRRGF